MNNLAFFALLISLFTLDTVFETSSVSASIVHRQRKIPVNPMGRELTPKEIRKLKPKIDGIPRGRQQPHRMTGKRPTVIGGQVSTEMLPSMVGLYIDKTWFCGGSLISTNFVLTAAHCIFQSVSVELYMASLNWRDNVTRVAFVSTSLFMHPNYNNIKLSNDIALIRLPTAIPENHILKETIVPIRLPSKSQASMTFEDKLATFSGWGFTSDTGKVSNTLNFVSVYVMSNYDCAMVFGTQAITSSVLCTSPENNKNACKGDSGSALYLKESDNKNTQIGIVSFVSRSSCIGRPSGYTRVSSFLSWISSITGLAIRS